jgi:hypothetical protein
VEVHDEQGDRGDLAEEGKVQGVNLKGSHLVQGLVEVSLWRLDLSFWCPTSILELPNQT